jgi:hypothetical protein
MNRHLRSACLAACLACCASPSHSAGLTTGADFLLVNTGARPDAMGGAFSAVADDVNTLSYNPAGLAGITLPEIGYGRYEFVRGIHFDFIAGAIPLGSAGVIGMGYVGNKVEPFNSTGDPLAATESAAEQALLFGWARSFNRLHLGAGVKSVKRRIGPASGNAVMGDFGFKLRLTPRLFLAGSLMNAGSDMKIPEPERPPTTMRFGCAWRLVENYPHRWDIAMDGQMPVGSRRPVYGWGTEYCLREHYALRGGWVGNMETEGITAGVGLKLSFFQLDYAFQPFKELGQTHRVSGLFRWNGPWLQGAQPNPPRYVRARDVPGALEIRWDKPLGLVESYEIQIRPMDGGAPKVYSKIPAPPFKLTDLKLDTLYSITMRSVAQGGRKSYPTKTFYAEGRMLSREKSAAGPSVSQGVEGSVDPAGLKLSWQGDPSSPGAVYNVYQKSSSGSIRKLTGQPGPSTVVWLVEADRMEGGIFVVSAVNPKDGSEKAVGSYTWNPTAAEKAVLDPSNRLKLKASPQPGGRIFLDWEADPQATGYTLLCTAYADGVYHRLGDMSSAKTWTTLMPKLKDRSFRFRVVSHDAAGKWLRGSREITPKNSDTGSSSPEETIGDSDAKLQLKKQ